MQSSNSNDSTPVTLPISGSFDKQEWSRRVRSPMVTATVLGASYGALSSAIAGSTQNVLRSSATLGVLCGLTGFTYYGTREFLNLRWKSKEMVETHTVSAALSGFVAGVAARTMLVPLINVEHIVHNITQTAQQIKTDAATKPNAIATAFPSFLDEPNPSHQTQPKNKSNKPKRFSTIVQLAKRISASSAAAAPITDADRQLLMRSITRPSLRVLGGAGLLGSIVGVSTSSMHRSYVLWKYRQLRSMQAMENAETTAQTEGKSVEQVKREIVQFEREQAEQNSALARVWNRMTDKVFSLSVPVWLKENAEVESMIKHRKEMDRIRRELAEMQHEFAALDEQQQTKGPDSNTAVLQQDRKDNSHATPNNKT